MKLKPVSIELPKYDNNCTCVSSDNTPLVPTYPFPEVYGLHMNGTERHAHFYELPNKIPAAWANRKMLCLLFKLDGLLFYWKTYHENGRVHGLNTQYHLHFYWAKRDFSDFVEYTANPTHSVFAAQNMYINYCPNTDTEEVPF